MAYASNRRAYGICDITGFRYRLKDMKMTWDGLHPQLMPKPTPIDPQALQITRPDQAADGNDSTVFTVYTNVGDGKLGALLQTFAITASVGSVEVTTS